MKWPQWKFSAYATDLDRVSRVHTVAVEGLSESRVIRITHYNCYWRPFQSRVLAHYTCYWEPFWKQSTCTLQLVLRALLKAEYLFMNCFQFVSFNCLIVQNRQAMQSMGMSMDWTLEDNMVNGLFFCATLTGRRRGHTPFAQAGTETSDTGAEAVKRD